MSVLDETIRKRAEQEVEQELDEARAQIEDIARRYCIGDLVKVDTPVKLDRWYSNSQGEAWRSRVEAKEREIARKMVYGKIG